MSDNSPFVQLMQALGGGTAGAVTRFLTQPFDVLKIRFQMQVEPLGEHKASKYRGVMHAFKALYVEEGFRGLMRGHNAGQVLSISYALTQFWSYEQFRFHAHHVAYLNDRPFLLYFLCGGFAGCLGAVAAQPFDVVRTQVVAADPTTGRSRMSTVEGLRRIWTKEGMAGISRGLQFTLVQIFPLVGANFLFYKYLNAMVLAFNQYQERSKGNVSANRSHDISGFHLFVNGALAGVAAKILVYPADLLKKRIQLKGFKGDRQSFGRNPDCPTVLECIGTTYKEEGIGGFYKGMVPTLLKAGFTSALYFTIYDMFNRRFIHPYKDHGSTQGTGHIKRGNSWSQ
ncbi:uncharacterized protein Dana_GF11531 [Drosophila ananassae]|uniref:CG3476-PA n=1 Tax=Drosophila ananassae TaxID=7217 RepID=B3MC45_DROAN|nr:mitochondrial thiamine pyrophosphate carrier [Drosophila ananassae]EDV37232.1 uncharacterized protein Dana_GF11531 [Drosophila ananassae]